jgi:hypothetical protein
MHGMDRFNDVACAAFAEHFFDFEFDFHRSDPCYFKAKSVFGVR